MARIRRFIMLPIFGALLVSMLGLAPTSTRAAMGSSTVTTTMTAGAYKFTLIVGPLEKMYTPAQFKKSHPKNGEIMVKGTMVMGGMTMGGSMPNHHLELHVLDRQTQKTVTTGMVSIAIYTAKGALVIKLPIAEMYGVDGGVRDTHFGNNVFLKDGSYKIDAQVNTTKVTFMVKLQSASSGMAM